VPEAARRGRLERGARRPALPQHWAARGLARLEKPEDGGKPRWLVHETADVRLARVKTAAVLSSAFDPTALTEAQRRALDDRLRLVRRWEMELAAGATLDLTEAKVTGNFLNRLLIDENRTLSRATLYNWLAGFRRQGVGGLVDKRWLPPSRGGDAPAEGAGGDPFIDFVKRLYLDPLQRTLRRCVIAAEEKAIETGWTPRSYKACQRAVAALPRAVVTRFREGEKAFEDRHEPAIRRDYSTLSSDDIWCGDHHDFDVMVLHEGKHVRPTVTAWQDVRSRKVLAWKVFAHAPNADTILAAFQIAVRTHGGVPGRVYVDNGKDYRSSALQGNEKTRVDGAFTILGVEAQHCWIYHGQSKPIERNFRTICDQFAREFDTYCGNSPGNRPETLQRNLNGGKAAARSATTSTSGRGWPTTCRS
jgi:transposase InsO family protein